MSKVKDSFQISSSLLRQWYAKEYGVFLATARRRNFEFVRFMLKCEVIEMFRYHFIVSRKTLQRNSEMLLSFDVELKFDVLLTGA